MQLMPNRHERPRNCARKEAERHAGGQSDEDCPGASRGRQHQKLTVLHGAAFDTAMSTAKWHLKRPLVASKTLIPEAQNADLSAVIKNRAKDE